MNWDEYWNNEDERTDADAVPAPEPNTPEERVLVACMESDALIVAARTVLDGLMQRSRTDVAAQNWAAQMRNAIRVLRETMHAAPPLNLLGACAGAIEPAHRESTLASCRTFQTESLASIAAAERLLATGGRDIEPQAKE